MRVGWLCFKGGLLEVRHCRPVGVVSFCTVLLLQWGGFQGLSSAGL